MTHQAHNLPWGSLTSNFAYTKDSSGVYDIRALDKPGQPESLVHFAKVFAKNIREYAAIERRKYAPAEEYKKRAKTWMRLDRRPGGEGSIGTPVSNRTEKLAERRKIYSDGDAARWRIQRRLYCLDAGNPETQYIDNWIRGDEHWSGPWDNCHDKSQARDRWVTYWTDDWKMLMMDAALVTIPLHEREAQRKQAWADHVEHMDTLFLLAHHPDIPLSSWTFEGDACCNMESGLVCIVNAALTGYIYFNMLHVMRQSGSKVCQFTDELPLSTKTGRFPRQFERLAPQSRLNPRPKYMNTPSWFAFLQECCKSHEHHPQLMMFQPFLYPQEGTNFTVVPLNFNLDLTGQGIQEVDVMTPPEDTNTQRHPEALAARGNHEALREFLRGLWKLMVNYEMLWRDQGCAPSWETMVVKQLEACFRGANGKWWTLFWEQGQYLEFSDEDLFVDGKVPRQERQCTSKKLCQEQRANNLAIQREARRDAQLQDRVKASWLHVQRLRGECER